MIMLILFIMPIIAAILVYTLFRQDLYQAQHIPKLKRGAIENLVERHRSALYRHLAIFVTIVVIAFWLLGAQALAPIIIWLIVFMGHVNAFTQFAKRLTESLNAQVRDMPDTKRLEENEEDIDDEEAVALSDLIDHKRKRNSQD